MVEPAPSIRTVVRGILADLRSVWPQLAVTDALAKTAGFLLLSLFAFVPQLLLFSDDNPALSDEEILLFFVSPIGLLTLVSVGAVIAGLGAFSAWNIGILDVMDQVATNLFLLGGGLGLAVFVGWIMKDPVAEVSAGAEGVRWFFLWRTLLRFAVPAMLLFVLWHAVPATLGAVGRLLFGS